MDAVIDVKSMIACCNTEEEADEIIIEFTDKRSYADKRDYLLETFPEISILAGCDGDDGDPDQTDYEAVLSAVINLKWR